jgi:glycine/serine hydroxymethyltransferase
MTRYSEGNPSQCKYLGNKKQDVSEANVQRAKKILNLHLNKILIAYEFTLVAPTSASFDFTEIFSQCNS